MSDLYSNSQTKSDAVISPQQLAVLQNPVPFSLAQQIEFTLKELRETLRDRRTIVTLLVMPMLLYPMLGLGLRFLAFQEMSDQRQRIFLAVESESEAMWLTEVLRLGGRLLENSQDPRETKSFPDIQLLLPNEPSEFDLEELVKISAADLGIRVDLDAQNGTESHAIPVASVQLLQNRDSIASRDAADYVQQRLEAANIDWIRRWAEQKNDDFRSPIRQSRVLLDPPRADSPVLVILPLILLLMTVTGGVYPAIDLTAGERERNTLETLMALPVPSIRILLAKFVAVVAVTMLTGLMNLLAMNVTLYSLQLDKALLGDSGLTIGLGVKLFFALSAFALFYSSVLLLLTSSARSFKEAQAYLIPLLLLSIGPGLVILLPGWRLTIGTAALPLVNMLLLSRELLEGTALLLPAIVAIVSTVLYGVAVLALAAQVFGNDAVAIGSRGRWADFLQRPQTWSHYPSVTTSLVGLAILFPVYFIVSGGLSRGDWQPGQRLVFSAVTTAILFVGLPWLLLRWQRVTVRSGFGVKSASWCFYAAACLFGLAAWPWVFELVILAQSIGIRGFDPEQIENVGELLALWKEIPLWLVVLCLGVVPGVCEECFFRGYLFNGLKLHLTATWTIVVSAFAFGLFHVVLSGVAAPERLLPSTLMGLLLGWMAYCSGSVVPSIILHAIHNSTLLTLVQSRDLLAQWNVGQLERVHLPWLWLAVSAGLLAAGVLLVHLVSSQPARVPSTAPQSAQVPGEASNSIES